MYSRESRPGSRRPRIFALLLRCCCGCLLLLAVARIPGCSYFYILTVRGVILDAQTQEPIGNAAIGAITIIDGQVIGRVPAIDESGEPFSIPTDPSGAFVLLIDYYSPPSQPDRIQLIINREGCEQRLMIDISERNAQFTDTDEETLVELTEPVSVPPCESP